MKSSRKVKYNDFVRSAIHRNVHDFFCKKNVPTTVNSMLKTVNGDSDLPHFKCSTFHVLLKVIGFEFRKQRNKDSFNRKRGYNSVVS